MPSSVRRLTTLDHERLGRLLQRMCTPGPSQQRWREEFVALLVAHRVAERDEVAPALVGLAPLAAATREQSETDVELDRLGERVNGADLDADDLAALHRECEAVLAAHASRWSVALMAPLEQLVARGELRRLGGAYEQRRDRELAGTAIAQAPPRRLDLSRAELYELARRAGIEGRSAMTRGQLIDELQRHSD
jgi:hypothetical protein